MPTRFTEELGTIQTEPLLQNVSVEDPESTVVDGIRMAFENGFRVMIEWENIGALTETEKRLNRARFQLATNMDETLEALRSNKKFVRLILEPNQQI